MRASLLACAIMIATGGAALAPAAGAAVQANDVEEAEFSEFHQLIEDYDRHLFARNFEQLLRVTKQLESHAAHDDGRAITAAMQAVALFGLDRDKEARKLLEESERLAPQNPGPSYSLFVGGVVADRADVAADAMDRLIARFPDVVREIEPELLYHFLRSEPEEQKRRNEDRTIALARLGYGGTLLGDGLASEAIELLIDRGDLDGASDLLRYVDDPQVVENMLIQRRYSPFWPRIEALAGPQLAKVRESSVADARRAYEDEPDSDDRLQTLANALRNAGRLDEAIALRSKLPADRQSMAASGERLGWAVNNIALALHESGRGEEADQLFALLNDAPMAEGKGRWRVSMIINRLGLLVTEGNFDRALPLIDRTEVSARDDGNDYARQLVRRYEYCTLRSLGRNEEAAKALPALLDHAKDAYWATVDALVCAGEYDKAEQVALEALESDKSKGFEEDFVRSLQPRPLTSDVPTPWSAHWLEFRRRPAIARAYEQIARDMPEAFLPAPRQAVDLAGG